jgi:hypothetical protein
MTTQALTIRRLSVTTHLDGDRPEARDRVPRLLRGVAEHRLDRALAAADLPAGTWCVRRLDVPVWLDLDRPDGALETAWATALVTALLRALAGGSADVVRYRGDVDALADLVCAAATSRTERAWAWSRLGLLSPSDPSAARDPRAAIIAALRRRPALALGAITTALRRIGLPPVHLVLGPIGWAAVAGIVAAVAGGGTPPPFKASSSAGSPLFAAPQFGGVGWADDGTGAMLAGELISASRLAELVLRSRLRPDPDTVQAWALLVAVESDSSVLRREAAVGVIAAVARLLADAARVAPIWARRATPSALVDPPTTATTATTATSDSPARSVPRHVTPATPTGPAFEGKAGNSPAGEADAGPAGPVAATNSQDAVAAAVADMTRDNGAASAPSAADPSAPPAPEEPQRPAAQAVPRGGADPDDEGTGHPTEWGGLLFLLATAADAGIPDTVIDDPVFAGRPLPWVLHGVAVWLGLPAADPAVAAFAGTDPAEWPRWKSNWAPTPQENHKLSAITQRWVVATAAALDADGRDPHNVVTGVLRRRGLIHYQLGWVDVELDLDQVDVAVRRAGLDLDPGWVPWLGTVVRFVYV